MRYDDAVGSLFQGPLEHFVVERKRLAGELKAAGDKAAAAKLAKLTRPPISAWVVDQLWWHARAAFDAMFETAQRLRDGELEATAAHRDAIAKLRAEAARILTGAEHGATEATLRRVTQTLAALAAAGSWDPDPPGALSADRDPPGFEAIGIGNLAEPRAASPAAHHARPEPAPAEVHDEVGAARERRTSSAAEAAHQRREAAEVARRREMEEAAARAEAAAALRRAEAERAKAAAERHRLEAALRTARGDVAQREREVVRLERELAQARTMVVQARSVIAGLEERLAQLDSDPSQR
jgi:hypothetical protein